MFHRYGLIILHSKIKSNFHYALFLVPFKRNDLAKLIVAISAQGTHNAAICYFLKLLFKTRKNSYKCIITSRVLFKVILVDGNGVLHVRKCGSASHLGVVYDIPTIGVAKNLVVIPEMEILRDETHAHKVPAIN